MNRLKDLKTFQKVYSDIKNKKGIGGGTGFTYFKVYKDGFQEILDFINQNYISKQQILDKFNSFGNRMDYYEMLKEIIDEINKI